MLWPSLLHAAARVVRSGISLVSVILAHRAIMADSRVHIAIVADRIPYIELQSYRVQQRQLSEA